jgi:hypothetical protein
MSALCGELELGPRLFMASKKAILTRSTNLFRHEVPGGHCAGEPYVWLSSVESRTSCKERPGIPGLSFAHLRSWTGLVGGRERRVALITVHGIEFL